MSFQPPPLSWQQPTHHRSVHPSMTSPYPLSISPAISPSDSPTCVCSVRLYHYHLSPSLSFSTVTGIWIFPLQMGRFLFYDYDVVAGVAEMNAQDLSWSAHPPHFHDIFVFCGCFVASLLHCSNYFLPFDHPFMSCLVYITTKQPGLYTMHHFDKNINLFNTYGLRDHKLYPWLLVGFPLLSPFHVLEVWRLHCDLDCAVIRMDYFALLSTFPS